MQKAAQASAARSGRDKTRLLTERPIVCFERFADVSEIYISAICGNRINILLNYIRTDWRFYIQTLVVYSDTNESTEDFFVPRK